MRPRVLVVDDDPSVHEALAPILELEGLDVSGARSAIEAEGLVAGGGFDVVVVDLSLSGGAGGAEGLALIERLAERRRGLPTVLLTARGGRELFAEARRLGARDALSKDMPTAEIVRRVVILSREHRGGERPVSD